MSDKYTGYVQSELANELARLQEERDTLRARVRELEAALTLVDEAMQVLRPQCTEGADVADTLDSFIPAVRAALVVGEETA